MGVLELSWALLIMLSWRLELLAIGSEKLWVAAEEDMPEVLTVLLTAAPLAP